MADGPGGGRGKWSQAGVPKKGWACTNVEDLGEPQFRCEMCETMEIRYVHYMQHPHYPHELACGVICAGHMEEDLARADERDKTMRSSSAKRKRFPFRSGWALNSNQNPQISTDGFRITIFLRGGRWKGVVYDKIRQQSQFTSDRFDDLDAAKMAAYDTMIFAMSLRSSSKRS